MVRNRCAMRFVLYNIRYATGGCKRLPTSGYLRRTHDNLDNIVHFLRGQNADVIGLVEVDAGSFRAGRNQARTIADALGHYHTYGCKYGANSWPRQFPVLNKQGNAFLSKDSIRHERFHYFQRGIKRLVIELELDNLVIFLVHLSLRFRVRHDQLHDLYELVGHATKPCIVAGDFNAFWGDREIRLFLAASKLQSADPGNTPSYPSWQPKRQLDFILHSPDLRVTNFTVPPVRFSDHLPLVCDLEPA